MDDMTQGRSGRQNKSEYSRENYASPKRTALCIALLLVLLLPLAWYTSAYTPEEDDVSRQIRLWLDGEESRGNPVGGLMDIEDAWAIEDTRAEAEGPLVTRMFTGDQILGFDRGAERFTARWEQNLGTNGLKLR